MISIDSIHRLLAIADVNRDPYAVASAAASLLAANAQDSFALGHYVKALGALKLTAAAARLTGQGSGGAAGGGVIPWASRARRFAANLRALQLRTPAGAALVEEASRELSAFELHQAGDGNFEVLQVGSGQAGGSVGMFVWMSGIADHKASAGLLQFDRKQTPVPQPVAFDGLGFGWLFMHLCDATARSFLGYSCAVYVCESDPLALAMLLHMHDLQSLIADVRTRWFIGSGTEAVLGHYREELRAHEEWSLPDRFIRGPLRPRAALDLERATAEVQAGREARREQLRSDIERYYAGRSVEDWARRFEEIGSAASGPLRVLGITSRYTTVLQHSMRELQAAAREGGVTFEVAIEPDDQSLENPYLEKIAALKPDLIVQLSRLRCENPNLPGNVPFLSWDQDNLPIMRTAQATASLDALTYVAGHAPVFGYTNLDWPRRNCIFCHAAAATHRYHAGPVNAALREKHACDISYVSNASGTPEQLLEQLRQRWKGSAAHLALFEELAAEVLAKSAAGGAEGGGETFEYVALRNLARARAVARGMPLEEKLLGEMTMDLNTFADRAFRHTALAWIGRWCAANKRTLRLYGNGWEAHPEFGRWAAGHAPPGEEARAIFQASRINLQLIQPGFVHSRVLDGLAAGGFFLTRFTIADGLDSPEIATLYRLARWVAEQGIEKDAELEAVSDPEIRAMVASTRAYYLRHEVTEPICPSLQIWAEMPAAACLFPRLREITFRSEAEFGRMAAHFLDDREGDARRAELAAGMRKIVEEQFSYGARWRQFMMGFREGLAGAVRETAGASAGGTACH